MFAFRTSAAAIVALAASAAVAQDWPAVPFLRHCTYQAVNANGTPAYAGGFPFRMVGVVINNTEDWLDPAPDYTPTVVPWYMGGQAEFYVQALTVSTLAAVGVEYYDPADFGGTAVWIGQDYGNHGFHMDPAFNYTDAQWTAELGRLNLYGGDGVTDPIRAGDLVEVRARAGLPYKGKYNVNEQHDPEPAKDFEIVRLACGFGLPAPAGLDLSALKNADNTFIFDPSRQVGGERYQATLVRLQGVWVACGAGWSGNGNITVTDGRRTLNVHLGLSPGFDGTALFGAGERFDVVGVLDQSSAGGQDGYQLLAMNAADFSASAAPAVIPGDADLNGYVDLPDLVALARNWQAGAQAAPAAWVNGNFGGSGESAWRVDLEDLIVLARNWHQGTPPGAAAVPEPAALSLLALGWLMLPRRRFKPPLPRREGAGGR